MAADCTQVGAAPGNAETCVEQAILMWIPTLDNEKNSKDNLYVKTVELSPLFTLPHFWYVFLPSKFVKLKLNLIPLPYLKCMLKNPSTPMQLFQKLILRKVTQNHQVSKVSSEVLSLSLFLRFLFPISALKFILGGGTNKTKLTLGKFVYLTLDST